MQQGLRVLLRLFLFTLLFIVIMGLLSVVAKAQDSSLLRDGGFEGSYTARGRADLRLPGDWNIWIADSPHTEDWMNLPPSAAPDSERTPSPHGGARSLSLNKSYATFSAAVYQQVSVSEGTNVHASVFAFLRTCKPDSGATICTSITDSNAYTRIGIDPNGGTNPFDADVVWSNNAAPHEEWQQMTVETTTTGSTATVFLYSTQQWPYQINSVYWDDAVLSIGGAGAPTAQPSGDAPSEQRVVHIVQAGETLDSIAFSYDKTRDELLALNNISDPRIIQIGQEIVIELPPTPAPTPTPEGYVEPTEAPPGTPTLLPAIRDAAPAPVISVASGDVINPIDPAQTTASICVTFFQDGNQNRIQDSNEDVLAGGQVLLTLHGAPMGQHQTTSAPDAYCFSQLAAGSYSVQGVAPEGYGLTTPDQLLVQGYAGAQVQVVYGAAEGIEPIARPADSSETAEPSAEDAVAIPITNRLSRNIGLVVFAAAVIVLIGGLGVSVLLRRR